MKLTTTANSILFILVGLAIACAKPTPVPTKSAALQVLDPALHEVLPNVPHTDTDKNCESGELRLDERCTKIRWGDGDTFSFNDNGEKKKARLAKYNTLESYGPVHRWGTWTGWELYHLAKQAGTFAAAGDWQCTTMPGSGGYGRLLVDCPDLRLALLKAGLAHIFLIDGEADPAELQAQATAIEKSVGMWEKGAPQKLITSLHSEDEDDRSAYNRICDLSNGRCLPVDHTEFYSSCQEIQGPGTPSSYMLYVPYTDRYGPDRADCLR